jgi:hypothetical protein
MTRQTAIFGIGAFRKCRSYRALNSCRSEEHYILRNSLNLECRPSHDHNAVRHVFKNGKRSKGSSFRFRYYCPAGGREHTAWLGMRPLSDSGQPQTAIARLRLHFGETQSRCDEEGEKERPPREAYILIKPSVRIIFFSLRRSQHHFWV